MTRPNRSLEAFSKKTLLDAPLELAGDWGLSPPQAVRRVLLRVREVCLSGLQLFSDQQPETLRVDNHTAGSPAIWLHDDRPGTAWVIVNIGPRDWSKLAYQFGHELGHVLCNSWVRSAQPGPPCQWLEEALVEAFSIRGLGLLWESWEKSPPFAGDQAFAAAIRQYREDLMAQYKNETNQDTSSWFRSHRPELESGRAVGKGKAVLEILAVLEKEQACVEDLGAANRWPARTRIAIEEYLREWDKSCNEIGAPGRLPSRLRRLLEID
ncbi:hypothetical protein HU675_0028855 [Bradyrhizobium septentrionale]|uniref:hypothetical protein n=1 Tax=Bradyrhizobium septentrionale TaxID=1404411 RepID=UPI001CD6BF97|nr:hypothetical protein [Bradyrhizobium septentrionale]UGY22006.1 hypothetical protein HU675_0028855 [Bradyrhizobium septentrionale]